MTYEDKASYESAPFFTHSRGVLILLDYKGRFRMRNVSISDQKCEKKETTLPVRHIAR